MQQGDFRLDRLQHSPVTGEAGEVRKFCRGNDNVNMARRVAVLGQMFCRAAMSGMKVRFVFDQKLRRRKGITKFCLNCREDYGHTAYLTQASRLGEPRSTLDFQASSAHVAQSEITPL